MNLSPELEMALVTFAAVIVAQLGKAGLRMLQSFVKGTKTNIDDKILAAVTEALKRTYVVGAVGKHTPRLKASRDTVKKRVLEDEM